MTALFSMLTLNLGLMILLRTLRTWSRNQKTTYRAPLHHQLGENGKNDNCMTTTCMINHVTVVTNCEIPSDHIVRRSVYSINRLSGQLRCEIAVYRPFQLAGRRALNTRETDALNWTQLLCISRWPLRVNVTVDRLD
ncbi:hypothetical protein KCU67_g9, partial [Aureobasidium melanogenum]